jgi:hypothetical protein
MGLSEVRRRDATSLVHELGSAGMSRRRQRALVTSLRALYDYAVERRLVRGNPGERIAIPDDPDGRSRTSCTTGSNSWCEWRRSASRSPP